MTGSTASGRVFERFKQAARRVLPVSWHLSVLGPRFLRSQVARRTALSVATGPFAGMPYITESAGSVWEPKLLGLYERELHLVLREAITRRPSRIVDIGAAEGYYAVGLARAVAGAEVYAFEADDSVHPLLLSLAERSGVSARVHLSGTCTPDMLHQAVGTGKGVLVVCDVEGAEDILLDPDHVRGLRRAAILVELHQGRVPDIAETLRTRFAPTHDITTVDQEARTARDYPYPAPLVPAAYRLNAVSEHRQPWEPWMQWYWMTPHSRPESRS